MNISTRLFSGLFVAALSLNSLPAFADADHVCRLHGSYGYLYNGTTQGTAGPASLTETGVFTVDKSGSLSGEGTLVLQFSNFAGHGPVWLVVHEVQSGGTVTPDTNNPCIGTINVLSTLTVTKTSDPTLVPEETVLGANKPRSLAYTISGPSNATVDLVNTSISPATDTSSPSGTLASGTAHKLDFGY